MSCLWFWCRRGCDPYADREEIMEERQKTDVTVKKKKKGGKWRIKSRKERKKDGNIKVEVDGLDHPVEPTSGVPTSVSAETLNNTSPTTERLLKNETETMMTAGEVEASNIKDLMTTSLVYCEEEPLDVNMVTTEAAASTSPPLEEQQLYVDSADIVKKLPEMLLEDAVTDQRLAENETLTSEESEKDAIRDLLDGAVKHHSTSLGYELYTIVEHPDEQAAPAVQQLAQDELVTDIEMLQDKAVNTLPAAEAPIEPLREEPNSSTELDYTTNNQLVENETETIIKADEVEASNPNDLMATSLVYSVEEPLGYELHAVVEHPDEQAAPAVEELARDELVTDIEMLQESESGADPQNAKAAESTMFHQLDNTDQSVDEIPTTVLLELASAELLYLIDLETDKLEAAQIPVTTNDPVTVVLSERLEALMQELVRRRDHLLVNEILATMASIPENKGFVELLELLLNAFEAQLADMETNEQLQLTDLLMPEQTSVHPLRYELYTIFEHPDEQAAPDVQQLAQDELVTDVKTLQDKAVNTLPATEALIESLSEEPNISTELDYTTSNQLVADEKDVQVDGVGRKRKTRRGTRGKGRKIKRKQDKERGEALGLVEETADHHRCEPPRRDQWREQQWNGEQRAVTEKHPEERRNWNHSQWQTSSSKQEKEQRTRRPVPQPRGHH